MYVCVLTLKTCVRINTFSDVLHVSRMLLLYINKSYLIRNVKVLRVALH